MIEMAATLLMLTISLVILGLIFGMEIKRKERLTELRRTNKENLDE